METTRKIWRKKVKKKKKEVINVNKKKNTVEATQTRAMEECGAEI